VPHRYPASLLITIDERRWMRGGYCSGRRRCAAGFLAESLGLLARNRSYDLYFISDSDLSEILEQNDSGFRFERLSNVIRANDDIRVRDRRRRVLREAFDALGYRVRFINKPKLRRTKKN
jgi:hypothetical protein